MKDMNINMKEAPQIPTRMKSKPSIPRHIKDKNSNYEQIFIVKM